LGFALNALDLGNHFVQRRRHQLVHQWRIIAFHKMRLIAVSDEQIDKFFFRDARQHGRPRDFVTVASVKHLDIESYLQSRRIAHYLV